MRSVGLAFLLVFSVTPISLALAAPLTSKEFKDFEKSLKDKSMVLRRAVNSSRTVFVTTQIGECYYVHEHSRLFPLSKPEMITLQNIDGGARKVSIKIKSSNFGSGKIAFYPPLGEELDISTLKTMFAEAFAENMNATDPPSIIGNPVSHIVHARGSNHLSPAATRVPFETLKAAQSAGYSACSICFRRTPLVANYAFEKTLGAIASSQVRQFNPITTNDPLNDRADRVGRTVLETWLVPLKGYNYKFRVVENDQPNAYACPAGDIYVTTGLMNAVESDDELAGVLAHEITHVERRHGYRQYRRAQTGAVLGALFGAVAGAAIGSKTKSASKAYAAYDLVASLSAIAGQIALSGYGRREESEADSYALAHMSKQGSAASYTTVLSKLKYSDTINGLRSGGAGLFMSHPEIDDRVSKARGAKASVFPAGTTFAGYDDKGVLIVKVSLDSQAYFDYLDVPVPGGTFSGPGSKRRKELQLFCSVEGTAELKTATPISSITVVSGGKKYKFDNKEDTPAQPLEISGMNFVLEDATDLLPSKIDSIEIYIPKVKRWEMASSEEAEEQDEDLPASPVEGEKAETP